LQHSRCIGHYYWSFYTVSNSEGGSSCSGYILIDGYTYAIFATHVLKCGALTLRTLMAVR